MLLLGGLRYKVHCGKLGIANIKLPSTAGEILLSQLRS